MERFVQEISAQQRVATANKVLARYRSLREHGYVSELQLIQYESEQSEQLGRLQALERAKLEALRDLGQIDADIGLLRSQIVIGNLQSRRALLTLIMSRSSRRGRVFRSWPRCPAGLRR
jgi:hypothetical protein